VDLVPIDQLERDWQRELANGTVTGRLRTWQGREPELAGFASADALIRYLRDAPGGERQDAVLGALVRQAQHDPVAARLLLQRLLPALKRRAGRMLLDAGEREQVWSLLLWQLWQRIRTYPVGRLPRHIAANLVLSSVRDALRLLAAERANADRALVEDLDEPLDPGADTQPLGIDGLVAGAVRDGALSAAEAELILATRIDGLSPAEAARARGISAHALVVRRLRAEQRLLLNLGCGRVTSRGGSWPLCGARVSGAGPAGLAGGEDQSTPRRR
jgi:DNA-directed RNA polymerase specialized sigma24 family protein